MFQRLRPGHRHAAALRRTHRYRAPHRHQHHRPHLGKQPGLADPGRRRHLRRLAAAVLEYGNDYRDQYKVDLYEEAFERRSSELHGIANLKLQIVANYLGFHGKSHNSLEDARMTARVYEAFLESDEGKLLIEDQSSFSMNPFGGLDLSQFLD